MSQQSSDQKLQLQQLLLSGGVAALALGTLMVGRSDVQEISWQDFKSSLLERRQVVRLEVSNKSTVKVYVRQPQLQARAAAGVQPELEAQPAAEEQPAGEWRPDTRVIPRSPLAEGVYRYKFSIGSVDGFERRLEEAQAVAGIPPERFVPVTFQSETSWAQELIRLAPTAALLALYVWFTRRQMGGGLGGGMGGPRGIFNVGKATVTSLGKQKRVLFSDVAGCDEAKAEVQEFVHFLKARSCFAYLSQSTAHRVVSLHRIRRSIRLWARCCRAARCWWGRQVRDRITQAWRTC